MSKFQYDSTGVDPAGGYPLIPDNTWHVLTIDEAELLTSKAGHPLVKCVCLPIEPEYAGVRIWHYVTFLPAAAPGAGIAVHFLKTIGEPWEGNVEVDPTRWYGRLFRALVVQDEYNGKRNNKIKKVEPLTEDENDPFAN